MKPRYRITIVPDMVPTEIRKWIDDHKWDYGYWNPKIEFKLKSKGI